MMKNMKYLSLLLLVGLLLFTQQANAKDEPSTEILDDEVFFAFGPREEEIDQVLADNYPEWASYKQNVEWDTKPVRLGEIISSASFDDRFNLNPAVILVVLGENLNWQIPPDSDLFLKSESISERLADLAIEWTKPENEHIRIQHSEVSNAATYALYAFFDYDIERLNKWHDTYFRLFPFQPLMNALSQSDPTTIEPFLARPFPFQEPSDSFYTINSFFDHKYPLYGDEDEAYKDTLYRFDGKVLEDAAFDPCDPYLGITCYSGHDAYDYNTPLGQDILAAASGVVSNIDPESNTVFIQHDNGLQTYYKHLEVVSVDEDASVEQGDKIGSAGSKDTGAAHLHFGVRSSNHPWSDIDPFGWWSSAPDPWSEYSTYGQVSTWLWKGDEAGDGYLTVDNRESQAQLFRKPPPASPNSDWHRSVSGYQNEAWYTFMDESADRRAYWGMWGATIETPGEYVVQAYWPNDPDFNDTWYPATNVRYILYYHENGGLQEVTLYGNQTIGANQFNPLCKVPYLDGICPEGQVAKFNFDRGASSVMLSNDAAYDPTQHQKILFFDAIQWQQYIPLTPTPTATSISPIVTPTSTPNQIACTHWNLANDFRIAPYEENPNRDSCNNLGVWSFMRSADLTRNSTYYLLSNFISDNGGYIGLNTYNTDTQFPHIDYNDGAEININGITIPAKSINVHPASDQMGVFAWRSPINGYISINGAVRDNSPGCGAVGGIEWHIDKNSTELAFGSIINGGSQEFGNGSGGIGLGLISIAMDDKIYLVISPDENYYCDDTEIEFNVVSVDPSVTPEPTVTPQPTATPPTLQPTSESNSCPLVNLLSLLLASNNHTASLRVMLYIQQAAFDIQLFHRVEDEILSQTPQGQHYIDLYYNHGMEITEILTNHVELRNEALATLQLWEPNLQSLMDGEGGNITITSGQVQSIQTFLDHLYALGSPELRQTIDSERTRNPLEQTIGTTMDQASVYFVGYQVPSTSTPTSAPTEHPTNTVTSTVTPTATPTSPPTTTPVPYSFSGFFLPVDNQPILNVVKAGSAVPVKFSLNGYQGLNIFTDGYPASAIVACGTAVEDVIEQTVTAGSSSLSYNAATNQYTYTWKTDKAWAGTCRTLVVKLNDGTYHRANFKFK